MAKTILVGGIVAAVMVSLGCSRTGSGPTMTRTTEKTSTTTTAPAPTSPPAPGGVDIDAGPKGATASGRSAGGGVDVNVAPNGGVGVEVQGEPIRERIRERRAARDAELPR